MRLIDTTFWSNLWNNIKLNLYTIIKDLQSFRNKLVIFTGIIWLLSIILNRGIMETTGAWTIIISYYFYNRQKSQEKKE